MSDSNIGWERKQFKGNKVWLKVDDDKRPIVKEQKVLIKYNLKQDYEYWVHPERITDINPAKLKRKKKGAINKPRNPARTRQSSRHSMDAINIALEAPDIISIFTDGASSGNPGPAGIGVVLHYGTHTREISKSIGQATNNVAELTAIQEGLAALKKTHLSVRLFTDSAYAMGVLTMGWKAKKNKALIQSIRHLMDRFDDIQLIKVPGHAGIPENERADALAVAGLGK